MKTSIALRLMKVKSQFRLLIQNELVLETAGEYANVLTAIMSNPLVLRQYSEKIIHKYS
jgi:hypothetical protein